MEGDDGRPSYSRGNPALGDFLRSRRTRLDPDEVGIPRGPRRRLEGLRRAEVADFAGISRHYYTRLEQGRHRTASAAVLDALARALRLPGGDRAHLYTLAQALDPALAEVALQPVGGDDPLLDMVGIFGSTPAVLVGPFAQILAANAAATFLYDTDFMNLPRGERNSILWMLLSPSARTLYDETWEQSATEIVGRLRGEIELHPRDPRGRALVETLAERSDLFRAVWKRHEIAPCAQGFKDLRHRLGGTFKMRDEALMVPSSPGHFFYVMVPGDDAFAAAFQRHG